MSGTPLSLDDIFADSSSRRRPVVPDTGAISVDDLYDAPDPSKAPSPSPKPVAPVAATPAPRRSIVAALGDLVERGRGAFAREAISGRRSGYAVDAGLVPEYPEKPGYQPTGGLVPPTDTRTDEQKSQDAQRQGRSLITAAVRPEQTATPEATMARTRTGAVVPLGEAEQHDARLAAQVRATEQANFSPEHWHEVARRGMELGSVLNGQGKRDEAQEVLRQSYNAQRIAMGAKDADTAGAIALSNMLGIIRDPYAQQRQILAQAPAEGMTFSPKEQRDKLDIGRPAAAQRGTDIVKDYGVPLAAQLPVILAGGAAGRGAAALLEAGASRIGARGVASALGRIAGGVEPEAMLGPRVPTSLLEGTTPEMAAVGEAGERYSTLGLRIKEEADNFARALPGMLGRGATEGQIVGGVQAYRMAREQGASPEEAATAAVESMGVSIPLGAMAELGIGTAGKALGVGFDPVGRGVRQLRDALRPDEPLRPVDRRASITADRFAGPAEVGQAPPPREPRLAELGSVLEDVFAQKRGAREQELRDVFARPGDERPAGPEFWQNIPPEELPMSQPGDRPLGPEPSRIERPNYIGGEPRPSEDVPTRTAAEAAMARTADLPRPTDEANAFHQMNRATEDAATIANARIAEAAAQRANQKQGPLTLAQTMARATREDMGRAAIAAAAPLTLGQSEDTDEKETSWKAGLASAALALGGAALVHRFYTSLRGEPVTPAKEQIAQAFREQGFKGSRFAQDARADYARMSGIESHPPMFVPKVDETFGRKVADLYEQAESNPNDPKVRRAYRALADETRAQYQHLVDKGVKFEFVDTDPYSNSAEMMLDVLHNNRLKVFKTPADAFHPLLSAEENDMFRAVHDYYGHAAYGHQFGATGEENAFRTHAAMFSPEARRAMATETRAQNSWVNFGPKGEWNRANPKETQFAEQKVFLMPDDLVNEGVPAARVASAEPKGAVIAEGMPSPKVEGRRRVRGITSSPSETRVRYGTQRLEAVRRTVLPEIAQKIGLDADEVKILSGTWNREGNPNIQVALPADATRAQKRAMAISLGYLLEQDAVPWITYVKPEAAHVLELAELGGAAREARRAELGTPGDVGAIVASAYSPLTVSEVDALAKKLPDGVNFTNAGDRLVFSNFSDAPDAEVARQIIDALHGDPVFEEKLDGQLRYARHDGELLGESYGESGEQWRHLLSDGGSTPELRQADLDAARGRLEPEFKAIDERARHALQTGEWADEPQRRHAFAHGGAEYGELVGRGDAPPAAVAEAERIKARINEIMADRRDGLRLARDDFASDAEWEKHRAWLNRLFEERSALEGRLHEIGQSRDFYARDTSEAGTVPGTDRFWSRLRRAIDDDSFGATKGRTADQWIARLERNSRFNKAELEPLLDKLRDDAKSGVLLTKRDVLRRFDENQSRIRVNMRSAETGGYEEMPSSLREAIDEHRSNQEYAEQQARSARSNIEQHLDELGIEGRSQRAILSSIDDGTSGSYLRREIMDTAEEVFTDRWNEEHPVEDFASEDEWQQAQNDAIAEEREAWERKWSDIEDEVADYTSQQEQAREYESSAEDLEENADWSDWGEPENGLEHADTQWYDGEGEDYREVTVHLDHNPTRGVGRFNESHWNDGEAVVVHYRADVIQQKRVLPPDPAVEAIRAKLKGVSDRLRELNDQEVARLAALGHDTANVQAVRHLVSQEALEQAGVLKAEQNQLQSDLTNAVTKWEREHNATRTNDKVFVVGELQSVWAARGAETGFKRRLTQPADVEGFKARREAIEQKFKPMEKMLEQMRDTAREVDNSFHQRNAELLAMSDEELLPHLDPDLVAERDVARKRAIERGADYPPHGGIEEARMVLQSGHGLTRQEWAPELAEIGEVSRDLRAEISRFEREQVQPLGDEMYDLDQRIANADIEPGNVPDMPFREHRDALALGLKQALFDAIDDDVQVFAWATPEDRMELASLEEGPAKFIYGEAIPGILRSIVRSLGEPFKTVEVPRSGYKLTGLVLSPELKVKIRRAGLPLLGVMALAGVPEEAQAQGNGGEVADIYKSAIGGIAAGAALMYLAQNRKVRRIVKENRALERALMMDDLSGLANKAAFRRAQAGVDADPKYHWVVFDGDRFKKLNDTHGHAEGDKAIQHFGKTVMDVAGQMDIPMRGFRFGGDEIAFAAPAEHAAEFMRRVEDASKYTKGDVTTKLTGGRGETFAQADAMLNDTKRANRAIDPTLRRDGDAGLTGTTLYANPVGPALKQLARYPSAAVLAGVSAVIADQSDNPDVKKLGQAGLALAALSAIGSRRLIAGKDKLVETLFEQLKKTHEGSVVGEFFNPDRMLSPEALDAIKQRERDVARARATGARASRALDAAGPQVDRAISDTIENENWEDTNGFTAEQTAQVLTLAAQMAKEIEDAQNEAVAAGSLAPEQVLPNYGGPRRYAYYEAQDALASTPPTAGRGRSTRVRSAGKRSLDVPIREAEERLVAAQASGDPQAIADARDALDEAKVVQMSRRTELGEIREASYRIPEGLESTLTNAANARALALLRQSPNTVHPEWSSAFDDLQTAKAMRRAATTPADRDAADLLINQASSEIERVRRAAARKGSGYVALADSKSLGDLAGAVVTSAVAREIQGGDPSTLLSRGIQTWKNLKTKYNLGTHQGNILSNVFWAHMKGLPVWEQLTPSPSSKTGYLIRAARAMRDDAPAARALREIGEIGVGNASEQAGGIDLREKSNAEGLERLLPTTRPETADVLRREGIDEQAFASQRRKATVMRAAAGAALGAAKMYDDTAPEDALLGAGAGALLGALLNGKVRKAITRTYGSEDDIFKVALWLKRVDGGMSPEQATQAAINSFGRGRSRSQFINVVSLTTTPFIRWTAAALPEFAKDVVDHPWRYMMAMGALAAFNEHSKDEVGEVPESELPPGQRRRFGYALPGFTQLPFANDKGERAAVDVSRWTPLSAATTAAPPGSAPASFSEDTPDIFRVGGPVVDVAARFGVNVDPFNRKPFLQPDYPARENIGTALSAVAGTALPSMLDFHADRIRDDIENRDYDKLKNDALGPTGLRPRFVRPGANLMNARNTLENSLREMKQDFRRSMMNNKNPNRIPVLRDQYLGRVQQALSNFRDRAGMEPPPDLVRDALSLERP